MTQLRAGAATDVGRVRANNQDQLLVTAELELFAVADGMGGHAAGEVASLTAVEALKASYQVKGGTEGLVAAAHQANRSIFERARADPDLHGMGTTLVAVALVNEDDEDRLAVVNVGDSRVYLLRDGQLEQLTTDHSLVQELVDDGQLTEQEATVHPQRHVLTRALGVDSEVNVDLLQVLPLKGDRLLLCSDGLSRELSDPQVASILRRLADPDDAARELVAAARNRGGNDNITVVIVDVVDDDDVALAASDSLAADRTARIARVVPAGPDVPVRPARGYGALRTGGVAGTGLDFEPDADTMALDRADLPTGGAPAGAGAGVGASSAPSKAAPSAASVAPAAAVAQAPKRRALTLRVIGFVALLAALIGSAGFAVAWYARGSYFVGLNHDELTIYRGRPGGLLWFQPTVARHTQVHTADVLPSRISDLKSGKEEPSLSQALDYVSSLQLERTRQLAATATTTTLPPAPPGGTATTTPGGVATTAPPAPVP